MLMVETGNKMEIFEVNNNWLNGTFKVNDNYTKWRYDKLEMNIPTFSCGYA